MNTPNGKPTFTNIVRNKTIYDKKGNVIVTTTSTVIKWPKSKKKQRLKHLLIKLGEFADNNRMNPYYLNWLGYTIKEMKVKYNQKRWYIPYGKAYKNFKANPNNAFDTICLLSLLINDKELDLTDETKKILAKQFFEQNWNFMILYPNNIDMLPKKIVDKILSSKHNKEVYEDVLMKYKEMHPEDEKSMKDL